MDCVATYVGDIGMSKEAAPTNKELLIGKLTHEADADWEQREILAHYGGVQLLGDAVAALTLIDNDSELLSIVREYDPERYEEIRKEALGS